MTNANNPRDSLAPTDIDPELQKMPENLRRMWMKSPAYQAKLRRRAEEAAEAARPDKAVQRAMPGPAVPDAAKPGPEPGAVKPEQPGAPRTDERAQPRAPRTDEREQAGGPRAPAEAARRRPDEKPEAPDPEAELREWEQERLAQADELGLVPMERGFPPDGFWPLPRMREPERSAAPRYDGPPPLPDIAEVELTALIAESRYLVREIVFQSARLACDPTDRIRFIDAGCSLIKAGSEVGKTVALLRSGGVAPVAERRQTITVEHVERKPVLPAPPPSVEAKQGEGEA